MAIYQYRINSPTWLASGHVALTPEQALNRHWLQRTADGTLPEVSGREWYEVPYRERVEFTTGDVIVTDQDLGQGANVTKMTLHHSPSPKKTTRKKKAPKS